MRGFVYLCSVVIVVELDLCMGAAKSPIISSLTMNTTSVRNLILTNDGNSEDVKEGDRAEAGGFKSLLCANLQEGEKAFFPCFVDCVHQHGSNEGQCGDVSKGDYNCYCGPQNNEVSLRSLLCRRPNPAVLNLCAVDCMCNHAATGGHCDYRRRSCICENMGDNVNNKGCPSNTATEFAEFILHTTKIFDIGIRGELFAVRYLGPHGILRYLINLLKKGASHNL